MRIAAARSASLCLAAAAGLLLGGCGIPADGPSMTPGQDCMLCHTGQVAQAWTVAGTLYADPASPAAGGVEGAQVLVTDAANNSLTLTTNGAGNFYTAEALQFPIKVQAQFGSRRMAMVSAPASGSCNSCHTQPAVNAAPGRIFVAP